MCHRRKCRRRATRPGQLCHQHYEVSPHGFVDATPVRDRLAALKAAGYSWTELAKLTGLSEPAMKLVGTWTDRNTVCLDTHHRVMAVPLPTRIVSGRGVLPAVGTQRRIRALMAIGWTQADLAREFGFSGQKIVSDLLNRRQSVLSETAFRVAEVFNRLQMTPGPSEQLRKRAMGWGWPVPLWWDEDTIDDPTVQPNTGEVRVSAAERIAELHNLGITDIHEIASHLGIKPESVERQIERSAA
jgi:transcriptional regulator with XRE-family HTH domain